MGVVRAALVKNGVVSNIILVDPEQGDYTPPEGHELVLIGDAFVDIGDRHMDGKFYRKLWLSVSPESANASEIVTVTAFLQPDTPDAAVTFRVDDAPPVEESVQDRNAETAFVFTLPGTYVITASSEHHGSASVEVVVQ